MQHTLFLRRWYGLGTILLIIMVGIGGMTRLTNSGLSMVNWQPVLGTIPPLTELAWIKVFNEYKLINLHIVLN